MTSITQTLGAGSGIDITQLVNSLVEAQFATKNQRLEAQGETLTAQISAVAELKAGVNNLSAALSAVVRSGSLATQPSSGNSSIVRASAIAGTRIDNPSASIEVRQLAAAQSAYTAPIADAAASLGTGKLTITLGTATVANGAMTGFTAGSATPIEVEITSANSSLAGIRDAINASNAGVTASILTDSNGARLVLKGATGEAQAFTVQATEDAGAPGLAVLNVGIGAAGTTIGTAAQDALVAVDGVALERSSNSISDLLPGVRLELVSASPGTPVSINSAPPTDNLRQSVNDLVDAINDLQAMIATQTNPITGPLRNDPAARVLQRSLREVTLSRLRPSGSEGPMTLAEIGVATNRDGTLRVDAARLSQVLADSPEAVEQMFSVIGGVSSEINRIAVAASSRVSGLGASEQRYSRAQSRLTEEQEKAAEQAEETRERMTQQFASMDSRVAAYRSTLTFLEQQIDSWNASDD